MKLVLPRIDLFFFVCVFLRHIFFATDKQDHLNTTIFIEPTHVWWFIRPTSVLVYDLYEKKRQL